jgi:type VI secretion system secreted protein VgrG
MALNQEKRLLSLKTPLGENVLLLTSFNGREELSRLFEYRLQMISDNAKIKAADIVGKNITVGIDVPEGSPRFFNGFVNSFVAGDEDSNGRRNYFATMVPWLWFLTQTADCRIFQKKKVPDILEKIYKDLGFSDFEKSEIKGNHVEWDYCVQYRETDFNFVSRLMEQEGICYYFRHEDGKHTLVMGDQNGAFKDLPEKEVDYPTDFASRAIEEHIKSWEHRYNFRSGKWAQTDYNFETPSTSLMAKTNTVVKLTGNTKYEVYDFPGEYADKSMGEADTKLRMEEEEAQHDIVEATSNCKTFSPGGKFKVREHRSGGEEGKTYVITSIQHSAHETLGYETGEASAFDYENSFTCIPDAVPFRPARITPTPIIQGVQTAVVVGPAGEEIYTDEFGRVKVQFHWDREGKKDENSSCWIRVSQVHAGKGFGAIDLPRIDEEVIVSFLEGNPDSPIITGRVYHAENMPPFGLPDSKVISGMKSNSTKGGGGYNEMIMDDTKGKEMVRIHAQYDMSTTVEHDDTLHVVTGNRKIDVDTGTHTETIKGDTTIKVVTGNFDHNVATGTAKYHVAKAVTENYDATQDTIVKKKITIKSTEDEIYIDASKKITLHTGSAEMTLESNGNITIKGTTIKIIGDPEISVSAPNIGVEAGKMAKLGCGNQNITCDKTKAAVSGAAINSSAVGMHEITGALVKIN